jgi:hypothetical protein
MENDLEPPCCIAANLPPRYFAVTGNSDFVRNVLAGELSFCLSDERNLWYRLNPVRIVVWF